MKSSGESAEARERPGASDPGVEPVPADLLEIAAHDAMQPLHAMKLQLDLLARRLRAGETTKDDVAEALAAMSARMGTVADQLRAAIRARRAGSSAYVVHVIRSDLAAIVATAIEQLAPEERARIAVSGVDQLLEGYWDGDRIAQVVRELVENAFKYSPPESAVRLELRGNGEVQLSVHDSGVGLAPEDLEKVFRPSFRSPRVAGVAGTGLGLYACRVIVEAHGGRIWAESRGPGLGSTFHVVLPR